MSKKSRKSGKLKIWQSRLSQSDAALSAEFAQMDSRERLYNGDAVIKPLVTGDAKRDGTYKKTGHVRNIIFENIEGQISSSIPYPKVTACRKSDEKCADIIENFLRNELDRLPFEIMNDMAERTVLIQGGVGFLVEWDNAVRTHFTVGEVKVTVIHPKQFAPQPGIYTSVNDMDWIIIKIPTTKDEIYRKFGKDVRREGEAEPELRSSEDADFNEDAVTKYIGFEKNDSGGINRYVWVNDVELEDLKNYQARRQPVCAACGEVKPLVGEPIGAARYDGGACPYCGSDSFTTREMDFETHMMPSGSMVEIPFYRPDMYPIVLQRSVSVHGQLFGNSDVDQIRDQQNTTNRLSQKINDRMMKAGTRVTLPDNANFRTDPEDGERWYVATPAEKALIDIYDFSGDISPILAWRQTVYDEARQTIGLTDSFQGRRDTTATSGKAKEFAAAQAAGRLESKRVMKDAAYADLFELMFKFWLAYSDEPHSVVYKNVKGENDYLEFNRYDFLEANGGGAWYWNDEFLFSCDAASALAGNREAMWQETRMNLQTGAFGDPSSVETLMLFWTKMEELHYPGAGNTKRFLEERWEREQMAQKKPPLPVQQIPPEPPAAEAATPSIGGAGDGGLPDIPPEMLQAIEQQAMQQAMQDSM
ncbi:MAG: hypothetical protein FWG36_02005 [Oscillospiraceae bacterium]|nr:hypothetical protein [Oscillospiraceae bacterium]